MRKLLTRGGVVLALLASSLISGAPASAKGILDDPPDDHVVIDLVAMAGSGCRPGTADVAVSPDNTAFTTIYSDYLVQAGPGISVTDGRRNCQLNVLVHAPAGYTFAIVKVDYRGYGLLSPGAIATQRANYYFQGMTQGTFSSHPIPAPLDDNWMVSDEVPIASVVWHPCGEIRNLNINTELRLSKGSSTDVSFLTMDSTDGSIETMYHLAWQPCP
ncbi:MULTISPECIES: DUF4360 domain-containing protein [unclassified Solwaraspora]|uniref:DUF4360 domain-containing protein n=1 Tax=unclassified Solwaraspora TaxID=2627926 RepID=UPI00248B7268|nr:MULTISPECIES: DUF4360 domain-containing protein [unclassified Solwaraspora]WBB98954.1 DUF4360 domain-containing protein [Solwaraspora sp. WMMA2059]WBC22493.1 DUF4360 domain-containing protein [Solwaraspora sp. WMMA2080]WJK35454.1 DUF4360 domain-containing protein [Solwaraspora sp. WMMA2065]